MQLESKEADREGRLVRKGEWRELYSDMRSFVTRLRYTNLFSMENSERRYLSKWHVLKFNDLITDFHLPFLEPFICILLPIIKTLIDQ